MFKDEDDDDPFDERGICKDGRTVHVTLMDAMRARGEDPVADGEGVRVPLNLMDGTQQSVAAAVHQGWAMPDSRPGGPWVVDARRPLSDAELRDARRHIEDVRRQRDEDDANRWRDAAAIREYGGDVPQNTGAGAPGRGYSNKPAGAYPYQPHLEGTSCTVDGRPGTLQRDGDLLVCRPTNNAGDARFTITDDALRARQQAYADADAHAANAWKHAK